MKGRKNVIKISLSTAFLIVAVMIIMLLGCYICIINIKFNGGSDNVESKISNLQSSINDMKKEISDLNYKVNMLSEEKDKDEAAAVEAKRESTYSDEQVQYALQKYYDFYTMKQNDPKDLLVSLNLIDKDKKYTETTSDYYTKTDVVYQQYKVALLSFVSEGLFEKEFAIGCKSQDGMLYYIKGSPESKTYKVNSLSQTENKNEYTAVIDVTNTDQSVSEMEIQFTIIDYKGRCVVNTII